MWIALSIIGLYIWLFKRKRKITKQQVLKVILIFFLIIAEIRVCKAQNREIEISGEILTTVQGKGKIIVFLVDETSFKKPQTGIDTVIVNPTGKIVHFEFKAREKGVYGIRCYHDINSNECLDKGVFGPIEPYGFSWKSKKKFPFDFSDISFIANSNKYVTIKMEN